MKGKFLLTCGLLLWNLSGAVALEKENVQLDELERKFDRNPANPQVTQLLLKELCRQGKPAAEVLSRYFKPQPETDYLKDYNWVIVRDYVNDIHAPQIQYLFDHQDSFVQYFSKDDVFQKLDKVLVDYLESLYVKNRAEYDREMLKLRKLGYAHYDVVEDYFKIRELRVSRNAEDYFYKARKLFRYFPDNCPMIKEITAGALEIMDDVARLKVIHLWAGKTVVPATDFDAVYNYALISRKCGYTDLACKYAGIANRLARQSGDPAQKKRAGELLKL